MRKNHFIKNLVFSIGIGSIALSVQAITIGLAPGRVASLDLADDSASGQGNGTAAAVDAAFSSFAPWTERGEVTGDDGASGSLFSVGLDAPGTWGKSASGTWAINDANFWSTYASVAISMHVGNGKAVDKDSELDEPDHFIWLINQGELSGTWSWDAGTLSTGGGLSNLKLFTSGRAVPDAGSTLTLLGIALIGLCASRRLKRC